MIKLKSIIKENEEEGIDRDRLFYNESYLDDVAEEMGYDDNFTKQFWTQHYLPTLYHCTEPERYEQIKVDGLKRKNERRGATSNRHIPSAVFTTSEEAEVSFFKSYYGPIVIAINAEQMRKDGFMPHVEKEPDWARAEKLAFVLSKLGDQDVEAAAYVDSSDQNTQGTVILYSDIPTRYLSLADYD